MRAAVGRPHNAYVCQRNTGSGISHNFAVNNYYTSLEPTERTRKLFGAVRYVYEKLYVYNVGESEIMGTQTMDTSIHNRSHPAQLCICFEICLYAHIHTNNVSHQCGYANIVVFSVRCEFYIHNTFGFRRVAFMLDARGARILGGLPYHRSHK